VKLDGTACLGEFSDEYIPSENTITLYASYIAPEQVDVKKLYKLLIDNYRDTNYEGEHKMESDIFAVGCCMIEVRFIYSNDVSSLSLKICQKDLHWHTTRTTAHPVRKDKNDPRPLSSESWTDRPRKNDDST